MKRRHFVPIIALLLFASPVSAQTPVMLDSDTCRVEPRSQAEDARVLELAQAVITEDLNPYVVVRSDIPQGTPASPETIAAITDLAATRAACIRALDAPRLFALYTERYMADVLAVEPNAVVDYVKAGILPPPLDFHLAAVNQVQHLDDGRASAFVTYTGEDIEDPETGAGATYLMVFERAEVSWQIDRQYFWYVEAPNGDAHLVVDLLNDPATPAG